VKRGPCSGASRLRRESSGEGGGLLLTCRFASRVASLVAIALVGVTSSGEAIVVYANDFQTSVGWEWSDPVLSSTPLPEDGSRRFLGQFGPPDGGFSGTSDVTLTLGDLPPHDSLTVSFDLYIMQSWDGNFPSGLPNAHGPDIWEVSISGGPSFLYTTFNNQPFYLETQYPYQSQSFSGLEDGLPDTYTGDIETTPTYPGQTGAVEAGTLGYTTEFPDVGTQPTDSVYHLSFSTPHTLSAVEFVFSSNVIGYAGDPPDPERWGLDNVVVITGEEPVAAQAVSWGGIKAMYR
jgi:hypothetical protein